MSQKEYKERKEAMKSKYGLAILFIMLLAVSFVAIPKSSAVQTDESTLIVDTIGEPMDLDPAWSYDTASAAILMNVYETLLWFNRTEMATYVPVLATEWTAELLDEDSPEGLHWASRWYFKIREGVTFQDADLGIPGEGDPVTPADVEYSFERNMITDCVTGPVWMIFEPLTGGYCMADVSAILDDLGVGEDTVWEPVEEAWYNTLTDDVVDHCVESNATHVWFNLVMPYEPFLQIVAQQWGSVLSKAWCVWHAGEWPGTFDDTWVKYHNPDTSPLYSSDSHSPGPNLDAALGSGPYILDYWNKGVGNSWSIIQNPNYWRGWSTPYDPEGWGTGFTIQSHLERYTSMYIPEWSTRRLRFLGGVSDFCAVPRNYMGQVDGQPGIECIYPLPTLACDGAFFNFGVSALSTHMGVLQPAGTFNEYGAPTDIFEDEDFRLAVAHMFDYQTYLYSAWLDEAISPVTPIVPGLSYYDPSVGKAEEPVLDQRKEYGITGEPADQLAYDMDLAVTYLQSAWGGALWSTGFTMDAVYNEGNIQRLVAAQCFKDAFDAINAEYGTKFHINIQSIAWSVYKLEWKARTLPYFIVGWLADYPDAHNFVHPFMHSTGAFSRWQGVKGVNSFPNEEVDEHIEAGIATVIPAERQVEYTWLQQYYVDHAVGLTINQGTGRHWQRDWVEGWYYNPIYPGDYAYDLWKDAGGTVKDIDVAVTGVTAAEIEIGLPVGSDNPIILPVPAIEVDVARLDTDADVGTLFVIIGVGLRNSTGYEQILAVDAATLGIAGGGLDTYTAYFDEFEQDVGHLIQPGTYTVFGQVLAQSALAQDTDMTNNKMDSSTIDAAGMVGDINVDGYVELMDFFLASQAFGATPGHPRWDVRCDLNSDGYVELMDFFLLSQHFGYVYPH